MKNETDPWNIISSIIPFVSVYLLSIRFIGNWNLSDFALLISFSLSIFLSGKY